MKTVRTLLEDLKVGDYTVKELVISRRKGVYCREEDGDFYISFRHKFYKNDVDKLVTQIKNINKHPAPSEEGAWTSAALVLLNFSENAYADEPQFD